MSNGQTKPQYWTWLATITDDDGVVTYPSSDFTIVECTDEDVLARLSQLDDYQADGVFNIKWSDSKKNGSHFTGDETAKDARVLAEKWANVRRDRDSKLVETDFWALEDAPSSISNAQQIYRQKLRDVPKNNSDPDNINWPTKP
tara:strand:- start:1133 stop:1564 length:432 start_codon:yes stop_codon:yes gene_type:complete